MLFFLAFACTAPDESPADTAPTTLPWSAGLPPSSDTAPPRGLLARRSIVHLHSPWSHDACDGDGLPEGLVNEPCLADLRRGLCETRIDTAFVTDHPAHAAEQTYEAMFHQRAGDAWVDVDGQHRGNRIACDNGHSVLWLPGIEDDLMPVGLDRHAGADAAENDAIYNGFTVASLDAEQAAGAHVFTAHTEQRDLATMSTLQDAGLSGTELFNLHAAFAPDLRQDFLGLHPTSWIGEIAPFTTEEGTAEPDLFVLAVLGEQAPSIALWDALLARGPMAGTGGTDAHQNVLPLLLRDGERGDSYRRMLRWFSNVVLASGDGPVEVEAALASGRSYVAFEILGTPTGFDFHVIEDDGAVIEMGDASRGGTLVVGCAEVAATAPHGEEAAEVSVTVFKDGAPWATGCGQHVTDGPGVYRARVDIVPHHLRGFLGADPDPWVRVYPWIYGNAVRVQ